TGVWRADIATGRVERVADGLFDTYFYVTDGAGNVVMRVDVANNNDMRVMLRPIGENNLQLYQNLGRAQQKTNSPALNPIAPGPAAGQIYVLARPTSSDLMGLYLLDANTGELGAPIQTGAQADAAPPWLNRATRQVLATCEFGQRLRCSAADRSMDRH